MIPMIPITSGAARSATRTPRLLNDVTSQRAIPTNHLQKFVDPDYLAVIEKYVVTNKLAVDTYGDVDTNQKVLKQY
jgi:hypothetical protein